MQNVLFRTNDPARAEEAVEFYAISISLVDVPGRVSLVREIHGWWDNRSGKITIDHSHSLEPETFESFNEAVEKYCALRAYRARSGYVHSFSWRSFVGVPTNYKRIEIPDQGEE